MSYLFVFRNGPVLLFVFLEYSIQVVTLAIADEEHANMGLVLGANYVCNGFEILAVLADALDGDEQFLIGPTCVDAPAIVWRFPRRKPVAHPLGQHAQHLLIFLDLMGNAKSRDAKERKINSLWYLFTSLLSATISSSMPLSTDSLCVPCSPQKVTKSS